MTGSRWPLLWPTFGIAVTAEWGERRGGWLECFVRVCKYVAVGRGGGEWFVQGEKTGVLVDLVYQGRN